ncbi:AAA family ATPase [Methylomagnum sp.]
MLTRIKISGYKSLQDVEVELSELSVLFGPNAAGKSNFLDALQLLARMATCRTLREAFEPPYRGKPLESFTFGEKGIKGLLEQERASFSIEVDVRLSQAVVDAVDREIHEMKFLDPSDAVSPSIVQKELPAIWQRYLRYRIEVEILPKSGVLCLTDEYLTALDENSQNSMGMPFLHKAINVHELPIFMVFDNNSLGYPGYRDHSILSRPHSSSGHPHLAALRKELESWLFFYFEPRERMRAVNPVKEVRHIGVMGEELAAFLNTLKALNPRQFEAMEQVIKTILPEFDGIDVEVNDYGEVELRLREAGISMPARLLSEGTLRILGLLALSGAKESPALIAIEEPENGIHPRRIELIAELLKNRTTYGDTQYIVTTHSPILPDLVPDESLYICNKKQHKTEIKRFITSDYAFRKDQIETVFDDVEESTISDRILRGDFDA